MSPAPRRSWIDELAHIGVTQPIHLPVAADDSRFYTSKGRWRVAQRVLKRTFEVMLSGQRGLRRERVEPGWKRAIWFHAEAPQIGDALMDLARAACSPSAASRSSCWRHRRRRRSSAATGCCIV